MTHPRVLLLLAFAACTPPRAPQGTEIGDEGPALCYETRIPVDGSTPIDGFPGTTEEVLGAGLGAWGSGEATLGVAATGQPELWDGEPTEDAPQVDCPDRLWTAAEWSLQVPGLAYDGPADLHASQTGQLSSTIDAAFSTQAGEGNALTVDPSLEPSFEASRMRDIALQGRATFDGGWAVELWWVGTTFPEGEDQDVLTLTEPVWSGRFE